MLLLSAAHASLAADPALFSKEMGVDPSEPAVARARVFEDVVVAPIPISNPTVGSGLAVMVMPFYHLGPESPLSNTAVAAGLTSSGSWGVGVAQSTRLRGDKLRLDGFLGYVDLRYRFYGTGADAGTGGTSVPIIQKATAFAPELPVPGGGAHLRRPALPRRAGRDRARERLAAAGDRRGASQLDHHHQLGLRPARDARHARQRHESRPSGVLVDLRANFADQAFGSDLNYETYELSGNYYRRAGPGVVALRGSACKVSDRTPLFDLCLFGANNDLRGYEVGRYRDRAMVAAQAEYRFPLAGRWGGVVFGGWGKVARSFATMGEEPDLPSVGFGVRWLASEKARVNLSLDVAQGRDGGSVYVYVKESF